MLRLFDFRYRLGFSFTIIFLFVGTILITEKIDVLPLVYIVLGMWLTQIIVLILDTIKYGRAKDELNLDICFDEHGVEIIQDSARTLMTWDNYYAFRETGKRFSIYSKKTIDTVVVNKKQMSKEQILKTRDILQNTQLQCFQKL